MSEKSPSSIPTSSDIANATATASPYNVLKSFPTRKSDHQQNSFNGVKTGFHVGVLRPSELVKPLSSPLLKKTVEKSLKATREFYQKNSNATGVVAAVILGAGMQVLLGVTSGEQYSDAESLLFMVCILEGLCLFFGNLIMMIPSNEKSEFAQAVQWIWLPCFIMNLGCCLTGIVFLVILLGVHGHPSKWTWFFSIPLSAFLYIVSFLIYRRLASAARKAKEELESESEDEQDQ